MEESSRFAVGIDIGTKNVRAVLGSVGRDGKMTVVGYAETPSAGMRRGSVVDMNAVADAVDVCLKDVEVMSGRRIDVGTMSINGTSIMSTKVDGMITILPDQEVDDECINRLQEMSIAGKLPLNRKVLDLHPFEYILDGQHGIREPFGMRGSRLELRANVVSVMKPEYDNLLKSQDGADFADLGVATAVMAAAQAVLTKQQMENGIAVVDLGSATTSVAVYDAGELQYVGVIPMGSNDITKDLAMVLRTIPEIAEEIKLRFASASFGREDKEFSIKHDRIDHKFSYSKVDEVIEARLEEIFEKVRLHLKQAGYAKRLPEGIMLTGGGAKMRDIDVYAREQLELAVRIGKPGIMLANEINEILKPEFATAIGLMIIDAGSGAQKGTPVSLSKNKKSGGGFFSKFAGMFK